MLLLRIFKCIYSKYHLNFIFIAPGTAASRYWYDSKLEEELNYDTTLWSLRGLFTRFVGHTPDILKILWKQTKQHKMWSSWLKTSTTYYKHGDQRRNWPTKQVWRLLRRHMKHRGRIEDHIEDKSHQNTAVACLLSVCKFVSWSIYQQMGCIQCIFWIRYHTIVNVTLVILPYSKSELFWVSPKTPKTNNTMGLQLLITSLWWNA